MSQFADEIQSEMLAEKDDEILRLRAELKARNDLLKNIRPVVALVENKLSTPPRVVREWIAQIDAFIMEDKT